jgi:hypothetical protein
VGLIDLSDWAWLGLLIAVAVCAGAVCAVLGCRRQVARDDAVADSASGMDEFSAPEGGRQP